ncbi:ATP-grasp domain-containing protein [Saccharothrix sp. BKS2]|uniref:ATP-grasp domain-containing protein n=1 Tax=Saccharothrix sp. BKS2 TaxID=3064400 RepID=UPI0039E9D4BF
MSVGRRRIAVVGSRLREYREYALAAIAARYDVALVTGQPVTWEAPYLVDSRTADTTDPEALAPAVADLGVEGVYTWDEVSLAATAEVAHRLGLPHLSPSAAAACRDKYRARTALRDAGLPAVRHRLAHGVEEARAAAAEIGYPVVLKPRSLAGSLGVVVAEDADGLDAAYATAAGTGFAGLRVEPGVLVEEFLAGPEISVDCCVVDGVVHPVFVARKRLGFPPYFEEVGHLVGPWRDEPWAAAVTEQVRAAHAALGVTLGVTHTELRLTAAGPRVVELNGRLGGDLIPHVGRLATGIDLALAAADLAMGATPDLTPRVTGWAEVRFLYPLRDGVVESVDLATAQAVPGIAEAVALAAPGTALALPPKSLTPRTAALIAVADTARNCSVALDLAEDAVRVVQSGGPAAALGARAENAVTRRFLAAERGRERMVVSGVRGVEWFRYGAGGGEALNRPVFLSTTERQRVEDDLNGVFDLLTALPERLFGGDRRAFATAVGMSRTQTDLVLRGADRPPAPMSRADMYREPDGFRLMELNTGSALGGWQMTEFTDAMRHDLPFRRFMAEEDLVAARPLEAIADLLRAECADRDMPSRPLLAITEWPDGFDKSKPWLDFTVPVWMRLGFDPVVCHLGQLEYRDGVPYVHGRKVDIVYRIFLPGEITDDQRGHDLVAPLLAAHEAGHTFMFAGLDCELYGNKGSLAMLSDERNAGAFDEAERALVDRVLPWTRFVRDEKVHVDGDTVDLLPYALANQEHLVLKPTLLYGGVGVVTGWTTPADEWHRVVTGAVDGPFVVQRRVYPLTERFVADDAPGLRDMVVAYGVLMVGSRYAGMLVRGIPDVHTGIVSMSNGAQIGCAFHVDHPDGGA